MPASFTISGDKALIREIRRIKPRAKMALAAGIYAVGNEIMRDSKRRVPVDSGTLRGSGYVTLPKELSSGPAVEAGYGGPAKSYAVKQHENTSISHPGGGEAKFLENSVNKVSGFALKIASSIARRSFLSGSGVKISNVPQDPDQGGS